MNSALYAGTKYIMQYQCRHNSTIKKGWGHKKPAKPLFSSRGVEFVSMKSAKQQNIKIQAIKPRKRPCEKLDCFIRHRNLQHHLSIFQSVHLNLARARAQLCEKTRFHTAGCNFSLAFFLSPPESCVCCGCQGTSAGVGCSRQWRVMLHWSGLISESMTMEQLNHLHQTLPHSSHIWSQN